MFGWPNEPFATLIPVFRQHMYAAWEYDYGMVSSWPACFGLSNPMGNLLYFITLQREESEDALFQRLSKENIL